MPHPLKNVLILTLLLAFAVIPGCKNSAKPNPEGLPDLVPCEVTILMNEAPLPGANVAFQPEAGKTSGSWTISGITDETGVAIMQTYGDFNGVPEGEYLVLVAKTEVSVAPPGASLEERDRIEHIPARVVVNPSFNDPQKTKLKITVAGKTPIKETFEVSEK